MLGSTGLLRCKVSLDYYFIEEMVLIENVNLWEESHKTCVIYCHSYIVDTFFCHCSKIPGTISL